MAQTLQKLKVIPCGGNYQVLKRAIEHFQLDTSHFNGKAWNRGKHLGPKQPISKYLNNELSISTYNSRKNFCQKVSLSLNVRTAKGQHGLVNQYLLS